MNRSDRFIPVMASSSMQWGLRDHVWGATSQAEQIFVTLSAQYMFRRELSH
jgi:hypothetical protein